MSNADDAEAAAFIANDHDLPGVTLDAITKALADFSLPLLPGRNIGWLAMAVRRSLAISGTDASDNPERTSNTDIRAELERLADLAGSTWLELFQRDRAAELRLWDHASRVRAGEGSADVGNGMISVEPSDYLRFEAAMRELNWMEGFLRDAAKGTASQHGPWRESERKRLRIERGRYLAPIYEAAFGQRVSANNWPSGTHRKPSAFMDFYRRMVAVAFAEEATPNFPDVMKEACRLHRRQPVEFAEGIIPGL